MLKNVQDEISRPVGSREIQKTKALPILLKSLTMTKLNKRILQFTIEQKNSTIHKLEKMNYEQTIVLMLCLRQ